jgi:hypothetical protein
MTDSELIAIKDRVILSLAEKLAICSWKLSELSEKRTMRPTNVTTPDTGVILQLNFGSHQRVTRVYCYDPYTRRASVRLRSEYGTGDAIDTIGLEELEALRAGKFIDVAQVVVSMAREIIAE